MDVVVLALAKKYTDEKIAESGGGGGSSAGFGTPTASATQLESTEQPTVSIEASGPNTAKVFDFKFGIPKGEKPVLGVDYWTQQQQQQIIQEVLQTAVPNGDEVGY